MPSVSIADASITEGDFGQKVLNFTLTPSDTSGGYTVYWSTADGTATTADNDYVAHSGSIHFDPGAISSTTVVDIVGDLAYESDEYFYVNLTGVTAGATIADGQAVLTILNDDAVNTKPVVTVADHTVRVTQSASVASWLTATDADGDSIVSYRFTVGAGTPDGYLSTASNAHVAAGSTVTVAAADIASVVAHAGSTSGYDNYQVSVFDGHNWSDAASFGVFTNAYNYVPSIGLPGQRVAVGYTTSLQGLIGAYSDGDGDPVVAYKFTDLGLDANSAYFSTSGNAHQTAGTPFVVQAADIGQVLLHAATTAAGENFSVSVFDGYDWSLPQTVWIDSYVNRAPIAAMHLPSIYGSNLIEINQTMSITSVLGYSDPDGDAVVAYRFWDDDGSSTSAYFSTAATAHAPAGQAIEVAAADLGGVALHGGQNAGAETLWVQAYDGKAWGAWAKTTITNVAASAYAISATLHLGDSYDLYNRIGYYNLTGTAVTAFRLWDGGADANSSYISAPGVSHAPAGQNIDVTPANLMTLGAVQIHAGSVTGVETYYVQAYDGLNWTPWASFTVSTVGNRAPVVTMGNLTVAAGASAALVGNYFNYTDADSDAAVTYRFWDGGSDANSGYFSAPGVSRASAGVNMDVAASNISSVLVHAGSTAGVETMYVQAYDGKDWGAWSSFTLTTVANHAPVVTLSDLSMVANSAISASSLQTNLLLTYADADSNPAVTYRFWDGNGDATGSYISTASDAHAAAGTNIDIAAANLGGVQIHSGSATGSETFWIQAFDGVDWSAWKSFTVNTVGNTPPNVIIMQPASLDKNASSLASNYVNYFDHDGDPAVTYRFWDGGSAANGGYFSSTSNAHWGAGVNIDVAAADLSSVHVHAGSVAGKETMWFQAYDGKDWSNWASFDLTTFNLAPSVSMNPYLYLNTNETRSLTSIMQAVDPENDLITAYRLWDDSGDANSAYFSTSATAHALAGTTIEVAAADIAGVQVHGGSGRATNTDQLWVQASDGTSWGGWLPVHVTTTYANNAPVVTVNGFPAVYQSVYTGQTVAMSSLFSVSDPEGDAITQYRFTVVGANDDAVNYLSAPGYAHVPLSGSITVAAADLGSVIVHGGTPSVGASGNRFTVEAYDGHTWGSATVYVNTFAAPNHAPVAVIASHSVSANSPTPITSWLTYVDADGDAAVQYQFWDDGTAATSGYFSDSANVREGTGAAITVAASDLGSVRVHGGSVPGSETLWARAFDGHDWGAWASFGLTTTVPVNHAPSVTIANQTVGLNSSLGFGVGSWLTASDPDGDNITTYRFWDGGGDATSGYFSTAANAHWAAGVNIDVAAADAGVVGIHGGSVPGSETLWVQVYDGAAWSQWASFTLTTTAIVNHAPVATIGNLSLAANTATNVTSLLSTSDADGDSITTYRFWDSGTDSTSGYFSTSSAVHAPTSAPIDVAAADLSSVVIHAGTTGGVEVLWVQAYDGHDWGQWSAFTLTTTAAGNGGAVTIDDHSVKANDLITLSDWFSAGGQGASAYRFEQISGTSSQTEAYLSTVSDYHVNPSTVVTVDAADLSRVVLHGGYTGGTQTFQVSSRDGSGNWNAWDSFTVTTTVAANNHAPVVSGADQTIHTGATVALSSLFNATDADGDILYYEIFDATPNGQGHFGSPSNVHFSLYTGPAALLTGDMFTADSLSDTITVRAWDGQAWSNTQTVHLLV